MSTIRIAVIGGGAAGMTAASEAAFWGADVTLYEKNPKLGKKLAITGKGRCNITNDCTPDDFIKSVPTNPRFLFGAINGFPPEETKNMFEYLGVPVKTERGSRVFPVSDNAHDVVSALECRCRDAGVTIRHEAVTELVTSEDDGSIRVTGVKTNTGTYAFDRVIVCTGGLSYPGTGSTGDGYRFARKLGLEVTPLHPSLVPILCRDACCAEMMGLSLKNTRLTVTLEGSTKPVYEDFGEMLFTHFGVSGPLVLTMSCHLPDDIRDADVTLNLKPGLDAQQLDARLQRDFDENSRKMLRSVLPGLLPARLAELFPRLCGVDGDKVCAQITREERETLVRMMQALPIPLEKLAPIEEAIVTRGGVSVKEIDPSTMESKLVGGLYFAGEVIDVDAHTGGYNLQIAWATGALAGTCAAEEPFV